MPLTTGFLVFLLLAALYVAGLMWLVRTGRMTKWNLSLLLGFVLMVRTNRGKGTIDFVARPRRFWNFFADVSIFVTLAGMVAMTAIMLILVWYSIQPDSLVAPLAFSEILVIPGVNPFVPLWYGLVALIVTLVVHEGGHGVLARANGMKLKSLGLLFAIAPVGAFVEPEELDLKVATRRNRLRVFSAGPGVNLAFAAITLVLFSSMVGAAMPVQGLHIAGSIEGGPAQKAGIVGGDVLTAIDGQEIVDYDAFVATLGSHKPGDVIQLHLRDGTTHSAQLASYWEGALQRDSQRENVTQGTAQGIAICRAKFDPAPASGGECADRLTKLAYVGIQPLLPESERFLAHPFTSGAMGALAYVSLPIGEVRGQPYLSTYMPAFFDAPFAPDAYWIVATVLFWIFWINLMVGLTNILPMLPLDGGHIFRDAIGGVVATLRPGLAAERRDQIVSRAATSMSLLIFGAFILQIFGPRIVQALT